VGGFGSSRTGTGSNRVEKKENRGRSNTLKEERDAGARVSGDYLKGPIGFFFSSEISKVKARRARGTRRAEKLSFLIL